MSPWNFTSWNPIIKLRDVLPGQENLYNQLLFGKKTLTLDSSADDFLSEKFWLLVKSASSNEVVRYVFSGIINFILLIIACNYAWTSHALGKGLRKLLQRKLKTKNVDLTKRQSLLPMIYLKQLDVSCTSLSDTCTAFFNNVDDVMFLKISCKSGYSF